MRDSGNGHDIATEQTRKTRATSATGTTTKGKPGRPKKDVVKEISIPALNRDTITIELVGETPLIMHRFSDKQKHEMGDKQQGVAKMKKPPRNPKEEYEAAFHWYDEKKRIAGFSAIAFKKAAVEACRHVDGVSQAFARGAFHVVGDILQLKHSKPWCRTDTVRIGSMTKTTTLRYRPQFDEWSVKLKIMYARNSISPEQIVNLFNVAGFAVGIGERRPGKSGDSFGMFKVK